MQSSHRIPDSGKLEGRKDQGKGSKGEGSLPRDSTFANTLSSAAALDIDPVSVVSCVIKHIVFSGDLVSISPKTLVVAWLNQPLLELEKRIWLYCTQGAFTLLRHKFISNADVLQSASPPIP